MRIGWRWLTATPALALVVAITIGALTPPHRGTVTGGILPCHALDDPGLPRYDGGKVIVLKGDVAWRTDSRTANSTDVLPSTVAAEQTVSRNGMYSFDLDAGDYVLLAASQPGDYGPFTTVTVSAGDDLLVDIPNRCI